MPQFPQRLAGRNPFAGSRERAQIRREPRGTASLARFRLRAVMRGEFPDARGSVAAIGRARSRPAEVKALNEIGVAGEGELRLVFGLDTLDQHELAGFVQQRDEARQNRGRRRAMRRMRKHHPVDFDDVGIELPHALEIRIAGAEVIERDEEPEFAKTPRLLGDALEIVYPVLVDLEHDAPRRQSEPR